MPQPFCKSLAQLALLLSLQGGFPSSPFYAHMPAHPSNAICPTKTPYVSHPRHLAKPQATHTVLFIPTAAAGYSHSSDGHRVPTAPRPSPYALSPSCVATASASAYSSGPGGDLDSSAAAAARAGTRRCARSCDRRARRSRARAPRGSTGPWTACASASAPRRSRARPSSAATAGWRCRCSRTPSRRRRPCACAAPTRRPRTARDA